MANVYIKTVNGGENTSPASTDGIELDDGVNSKWAQLANLYKGLGLSVLLSSEVSVTTTANLSINTMHVCSGTSSDYTVTLPAASGNGGKWVGVRGATALTKKITVDGNGAETVNGVASTIIQAGDSMILLCDGSNWFVLAERNKVMASVNFTGTGTPTITKSFNVSSITDNGTGDWTVNYTYALPDALYTVSLGNEGLTSSDILSIGVNNTGGKTTSSVRILGVKSGLGVFDVSVLDVVCLRQ